MPGGLDEMELVKEFTKDPEFAVQETETPALQAPIVTPEIPQKEISNVVDQTPVEKTDAATIINTSPEKEVNSTLSATPEVVNTPEIDYDKLLGEKSNGRIKSQEELNKLVAEYDETRELLNSDTYQYAAKLSAWEKAGHPKELFAPIQELDANEIKELDSRDLVALKLKFENPNWSEEDISILINEEFKQDPDSHTENVIRAGRLKMEREANAFRGKLGELKELSFVPKAEDTRAAAQQVETLRQNTWKQNLPKFVNEFNKISLPLDKAGKDIFDWIPTKEQKQELLLEMERIVTNAPVKFDEEGIKAFQSVMKEKFINKNINEISSAIASRATSKKTEEVIKEIHNPTGARNEPIASSPETKSEVEIAFDKIYAQEVYGNGRR